MSRRAELTRETGETNVAVTVVLDGEGRAEVSTGIGFLNHMLSALARHSRIDLSVHCSGDLEVDDHHSVEDCALTLGGALDRALGERRGIARFGWALAPLDEALARAAVDLSGRAHATVNLGLQRPAIGSFAERDEMATENLTHFLQSLALGARATLHVDVLRGENDHHRAEAAFKALALALGQAVALIGPADVPSTKGML